MECPKCFARSSVKESRPLDLTKDGIRVRHYVCPDCGFSVYSHEVRVDREEWARLMSRFYKTGGVIGG